MGMCSEGMTGRIVSEGWGVVGMGREIWIGIFMLTKGLKETLEVVL